jgi:hypothetical protein
MLNRGILALSVQRSAFSVFLMQQLLGVNCLLLNPYLLQLQPSDLDKLGPSPVKHPQYPRVINPFPLEAG